MSINGHFSAPTPPQPLALIIYLFGFVCFGHFTSMKSYSAIKKNKLNTYNLDEVLENYAEWKKPLPKGYILL